MRIPNWMKYQHIYKNTTGYTITKTINGNKINFGTYHTLKKALTTRNQLIIQNWTPKNPTLSIQYNKRKKRKKEKKSTNKKKKFQTPTQHIKEPLTYNNKNWRKKLHLIQKKKREWRTE